MEKIGEVTEEGIVEVYCDICGKSTKDDMGNFECATLYANWGYSSNKDGEVHKCYICETCYDTVKILLEGIGGCIRIEDTMKESEYRQEDIAEEYSKRDWKVLSKQENIFKDACGCDGNCSECKFKKLDEPDKEINKNLTYKETGKCQ